MATLLGVLKANFHLAIRNNLLLVALYLLLVPALRGISNLDAAHSAECLEQSIRPIGIALLVPLCAAEQKAAIWEVTFAKRISGWVILLLRFLMAMVACACLTSIFAGVMKMNHCSFPYMSCVLRTVVAEVALGSLGFLVAVLSRSTIAGYLLSVGCFFAIVFF